MRQCAVLARSNHLRPARSSRHVYSYRDSSTPYTQENAELEQTTSSPQQIAETRLATPSPLNLLDERLPTAPVSHQKPPQQSSTNAYNPQRKRSKINKGVCYSAAHNGLAAGSTRAEPATRPMAGHSLLLTAPQSRSQYLPGAKSWMYRSLAASTSARKAESGCPLSPLAGRARPHKAIASSLSCR